jgi:hypothetical protein
MWVCIRNWRLTKIDLEYDKEMWPTLVTIDLNGAKIQEMVIVDTGYLPSPAGDGLILPSKYLEHVKDVTEETVAADAFSSEGSDRKLYRHTKIMKVMDYTLKQPLTMPTMFGGKLGFLGNAFLRNCSLYLDGVKRTGYLELNPSW